MKISFENPDKINGLLTLVVEEEDYKNDVEKTLKDYRKKANVPGFRPGQAPMGMIKRQFGPSVKMEAINKLVGQQIYKYVQDIIITSQLMIRFSISRLICTLSVQVAMRRLRSTRRMTS